jgi:hypothetical protein
VIRIPFTGLGFLTLLLWVGCLAGGGLLGAALTGRPDAAVGFGLLALIPGAGLNYLLGRALNRGSDRHTLGGLPVQDASVAMLAMPLVCAPCGALGQISNHFLVPLTLLWVPLLIAGGMAWLRYRRSR